MSKQLFSTRQTALILILTTAVVAVGLHQTLAVDIGVWWQAAGLVVGSYVIAAVLLLGVDEFVSKVYTEYRRLSP